MRRRTYAPSSSFYVETVAPATGEQLEEGEVGTFCVTPLWTGHATPFLRWNSGDMVSFHEHGKSSGKYAELFPMIRHARRTMGFFKIRGVNINHAEFEDFIFRIAEVNDFQGVLVTDESGIETLRVRVEIKRGTDAGKIVKALAAKIKRTFEVNPEIQILDLGTLAKAFESSIKAPRFVDERV